MKIAPSAALQVIEIAAHLIFVRYGPGQSFDPPDIEPSQIIGELDFKLPRDAPCGDRYRAERYGEQHSEEFEREQWRTKTCLRVFAGSIHQIR